MWRFVYTLAIRAALPFVVLKLWWRGRREPGYRRHVAERFGDYRFGSERPVIWLHAVSVGEARAAAPLVRALQSEFGEHRILITCTTAAGRETVKQTYGESVLVAWLPYDYPGATRRFLAHFRPRLGLVMETEIWPNLLASCREFAVPVILANGRMSERSARGYLRWRFLTRPAFAGLAGVCAQSEADATRLAALGAPTPKVTGNLKFDIAPDPAQTEAGRRWRSAVGRPVLLLASTRSGEERMLLDAFPPSGTDALVVIVPRHPQRFDEVALLIGRDSEAPARRSQGAMPRSSERFLLGDSLGEMVFYYAACDVAVIGGSFAPHGGQNLIEACAAGVPVVLGPSMFNFAEATRLALEAGAAVQVGNASEAMRVALSLCTDPARREKMGAAGRALCLAHRGATDRHLELCRQWIRAAARD